MNHSREQQSSSPFPQDTLQLMTEYDRRKLLQNISYIDQLRNDNQWQIIRNMRDRAIKRAEENPVRTQSVKIKNQLHLAYLMLIIGEHDEKKR